MSELLREPVSLGLEDSKRHLRFSFTCPEGARGLTVRWSFGPAGAGELRTLITVSLHGPEGFRGEGHRHGTLHEVTLTEDSATPGYLAGAILPGPWTLTLHTHLVLGPTTGEVVVSSLDLPGEARSRELPARPPLASRQEERSGAWMLGDLHCHTRHSDGRWTPAELAAAATGRGLSFLALTDHNTTSGRAELAAAFPGLTLPGTELTTFHGHALVLGLAGAQDWMALEPQSGMADLATQVDGSGGVLVLAHPFAVGDPICTGCAWTYFDLRPENAAHMEVWNGPWQGRHNERALAYWYRLLAQGRRIVATVGTDAHGPDYLPGVGFTSTPSTPEPGTLLSQLRQGNTCLTTALLVRRLTVTAPDGEVPLGAVGTAGQWTARLDWADLPAGCTLCWVVDGVRLSYLLEPDGTREWVFPVKLWLNLELRGADGAMLALSNPVYGRR